MQRSALGSITISLITLTTIVTSAHAQKPDSTLLRPTIVMVKIANDVDTTVNGTYRASGVSTKCGLADYSYPHRLNSFAVIFPDDTTTIDVTSVNFDADTLKAGTTVSSFYLSVAVRTRQGGTPPAYVIRPNQPQYKEPGTANLTRPSKSVDSLTVKGIATTGTKVDVEMTLVCRPSP